MRHVPVPILSLLVLGYLCDESLGHPGGISYPIYEIPSDSLHILEVDGSLEDWYRLVPGPSVTSGDLIELRQSDISGEGAYSPLDDDWRLYIAWNGDRQRFYVAFERARFVNCIVN